MISPLGWTGFNGEPGTSTRAGQARSSRAPIGRCRFRRADPRRIPVLWQAILRAAVAVESLQASGAAIEAGPIPALRPQWLSAVEDGTTEMRLAVSLGSAAADYSPEGQPIDPIRHHWLPLEAGHGRQFKLSDKRLVQDSRVVMTGAHVLLTVPRPSTPPD